MISIDPKAIFQSKKLVFWLLGFLIIIFSVILLIPKSVISPTSNYFEESEILWKDKFEKGLHFYETEELDSAFHYFSESASEVKFIDTFSISSYYWMSKCLFELNLLDSAIFVIEKGLAMTSYRKSRSAYFSNYNDLLKTYFLKGKMYRETTGDPEIIFKTYIRILDISKQKKDTASLISAYEEFLEYCDQEELDILPVQVLKFYEKYLYKESFDPIPPHIADIVSQRLIDLNSQLLNWNSTFENLGVEMNPKLDEENHNFNREDRNIFDFRSY